MLGFDIPSGFRIVQSHEPGWAPGDLYYEYTIEYPDTTFATFMQQWSATHEGLSWSNYDVANLSAGVNPRLDVWVKPEVRQVYYSYAED